MRAVELFLILSVLLGTRAQATNEDRNCAQNGFCQEGVPHPPPPVSADRVAENPPKNFNPAPFEAAAGQCIGASDEANDLCNDKNQDVQDSKNELQQAGAAIRSQDAPGNSCRTLASKANRLASNADAWRGACYQKYSTCSSLCSNLQGKIEAAGGAGSQIHENVKSAVARCSKSGSAYNQIRASASYIRSAADDYNRCADEMQASKDPESKNKSSGNANPTSDSNGGSSSPSMDTASVGPLTPPIPAMANQANLCDTNPRACGDGSANAERPHATQAPAGEDDRVGTTRKGTPDLGFNQALAQRALQEESAARMQGSSNELPTNSPTANVGNGFTQGKNTGKHHSGASNTSSSPQVLRGYYPGQLNGLPGAPTYAGAPGSTYSYQRKANPRATNNSQAKESKAETRKLWAAKLQSEIDRKLAGLSEGTSGPDGITGPHSVLWRKVRTRYLAVERSLIP